MKFVIVVTLLVVLFIASMLLFPYAGEIASSLTPKPTPKLKVWVDKEPAPVYDPENCTIQAQWTIANDGDPASDILVELAVLDKSTGETVAKKIETVGRIEKGQENSRLVKMVVGCVNVSQGSVLYEVTARIVNYSV